jgi:hypothetical protein
MDQAAPSVGGVVVQLGSVWRRNPPILPSTNSGFFVTLPLHLGRLEADGRLARGFSVSAFEGHAHGRENRQGAIGLHDVRLLGRRATSHLRCGIAASTRYIGSGHGRHGHQESPHEDRSGSRAREEDINKINVGEKVELANQQGSSVQEMGLEVPSWS